VGFAYSIAKVVDSQTKRTKTVLPCALPALDLSNNSIMIDAILF